MFVIRTIHQRSRRAKDVYPFIGTAERAIAHVPEIQAYSYPPVRSHSVKQMRPSPEIDEPVRPDQLIVNRMLWVVCGRAVSDTRSKSVVEFPFLFPEAPFLRCKVARLCPQGCPGCVSGEPEVRVAFVGAGAPPGWSFT